LGDSGLGEGLDHVRGHAKVGKSTGHLSCSRGDFHGSSESAAYVHLGPRAGPKTIAETGRSTHRLAVTCDTRGFAHSCEPAGRPGRTSCGKCGQRGDGRCSQCFRASATKVISVQCVTADDLVDAFRRGDESAIARLYEAYGSLVYAVSMRVLKNQSLAEDATQETFVKAWQGAASFDRSKELAPWLSVIAKRVAIDISRRETRRSHDQLDERVSETNDLFRQLDEVWRVRTALDSLRAEDRSVLRMLHYQGLSHQEVSEQLVVPLGTVKSRAYAARQHLIERLQQYDAEKSQAGLRPAEDTR
jgi:RNA polymerase sigma factor (sigma-70 family)